MIRILQSTPTRAWLVWIPAIFAAWANLHGGWIVGFGVLVLWCGCAALETWRSAGTRRWLFLAVPVVSLAVTLINPYGSGLLRFLAATVRFSRPDIREWDPLVSSHSYIWIPTLITTAVVAAACLSARTRPSWPGIAVAAALAVASLRVSRVAFLSVPAMLLIAAPALSVRWPRPAWHIVPPTRAAALLTLIPIMIGGVATARVVQPTFACIPIVGRWRPDFEMVSWLRASAAEGRLVTPYDWGEYALWHLGTRLRVSMDGRRETIYSESTQTDQQAVYAAQPRGQMWLLRERPEYVWVPARSALSAWLENVGYRIDLRTDESFVAVRSDLPRLSQPSVGTPVPLACFPGP